MFVMQEGMIGSLFHRLRLFISLLFIGLNAVLFTSCEDQPEVGEAPHVPSIKFDLDSIKQRGYLILLTENSASTYFIYRNQPKGFDFEMAEAFAKSIGVKLRVRILDDVDKMFELLRKGEGDIIASNLTVTDRRKGFVSFSHAMYQTRQVLVQQVMGRDSVMNTMVRDIKDLPTVPIFVHRYSSFYEELKSIEKQHDLTLDIHEAPGGISTDDLLRLVNDGEMRATITDENLLSMDVVDYPNIDLNFALTDKQDIAWAMRKNAPELRQAINEWMHKRATKRKLAAVYKKYFTDEKQNVGIANYKMPQVSPGQISPYDSLFKLYAPQIGWDWRMLAALAYQESRFNPNAQSWSGASGLMQLMPQTAIRFGCDSFPTPECSVHAAVKYIKYLQGIWRKKIPNPAERTKFVLASYNIGQGHVLDAYNLAAELGMTDTLWEGNVAEALLLKQQEKYYTMPVVKHGYCYAKEPYHFVGKITALFEHYKANTQ
jgi:membrane-bound lytic murein transglycosylase F